MSDQKIQFKIVTPERSIYESTVDQVTLPVLDGQVTILPDHMPYIGALKSGEMVIQREGEEIILAISGGLLEFKDNVLVVLADTAEVAHEIDIERAEEARARAEMVMKQKVSMSEMEYARVTAAVEKQLARLKVAKRSRGAHQINLN